MADSNHANYAKIGLAVLLGVAGIVLTLIYLGGVGAKSDFILAETYYPRSVSGLSKGSPVNFRGVKIGEVREITFVGNKYDVMGTTNQMIYVQLAFDRHEVGMYEDEGLSSDEVIAYLVEHEGLRAIVSASGITGMSRIECDLRPDAAKPDPISWKPATPYIPQAESLLESFSVSATKVMNQINKMDIAAVWSNINVTVDALAQSASAARILMDSQLDKMQELSENLTAASRSIRSLMDELRRNPSLLVRERKARPLEETE